MRARACVRTCAEGLQTRARVHLPARELAQDLSTPYGTPHDKVVATPCVVSSRSVGHHRACKVTRREDNNTIPEPNKLHFLSEAVRGQ